MNRSPEAALTELRALVATMDPTLATRLPPERRLVETLGLNRPALRKALAVLEAEGQIWRHVGKGTFVGTRPLNDLGDVAAIARKTNPGEVMRTRVLLEPEVAAHPADAIAYLLWPCYAPPAPRRAPAPISRRRVATAAQS